MEQLRKGLLSVVESVVMPVLMLAVVAVPLVGFYLVMKVLL